MMWNDHVNHQVDWKGEEKKTGKKEKGAISYPTRCIVTCKFAFVADFLSQIGESSTMSERT